MPNEKSIETPSLIFYEDRIQQNISIIKNMIDDVKRLRPHVKTHKCLEVCKMLINEGINKFKCATIAEAEMLGMAQARDVLLAYQPVAENINRFFKLINAYKDTNFSCLVDDLQIAKDFAAQALLHGCTINIYLDLNVGMNRTGILPNLAQGLVKALITIPQLEIKGLHAYDGHIHDAAIDTRKAKTEPIIDLLKQLKKEMESIVGSELKVIAGGTPTFPVYATETDFDCSPGTFILWDKGYQDAYQEQNFLTAALVATRIVSLPNEGLVCTDLGHKAVAAEKELNKRVFFINAPKLLVKSQSEEHLVLGTTELGKFKIGGVLYGLPYHICPTVALYENAVVVSEDKTVQNWTIVSRKRKITI